GTVQKAVERTGYADFWELYKRNVLPKETKNYVPIILAITIMSKNPAQYGLSDVQMDAPAASDAVTIDYPVDLRLVAECVDSSVDQLQALNPSLLRMTTPKDEAFTLHLPVGTKDKFEQQIAAIPLEKRVLWRFHRVQPGDTLASIARKYHVSAEAISEANDLRDDEVKADAKLIIPVATSRSRETASAETAGSGGYSKHATVYKVRKGDTVESVADDFSVPAEKVRKWNHLASNKLTPGRVLHIYKPLGEVEEAHTRTSSKHGNSAPELSAKNSSKKVLHHTVKRGETLTSIASQYKITVSELKKENPKVEAKLRPGDVLVIRR